MTTTKARRRRKALAFAITAAIVGLMTITLIVINGAALIIGYQGEDVDWVVVVATVVADVLLIGIIYQLVHETLLAIAERRRTSAPVPALLSGLLVIYTLVLWIILAPTINRFGVAADLGIFTRGWTEPESQLIRTAVVFAFVVLSYYWIVWRYRRGGLLDALAAALREFRAAPLLERVPRVGVKRREAQEGHGYGNRLRLSVLRLRRAPPRPGPDPQAAIEARETRARREPQAQPRQLSAGLIMADAADRRILQTGPIAPTASPSRARNFLARQADRILSDDEIAQIVAAIWRIAALLDGQIDPALLFAQFCVETDNGRFTGEVPASAHNPAGIGAIGDGSYLSFPDWPTGILVFGIHLLAWLDRLDLARKLTDREPGVLDPRLGLVAAARATKGAATTYRSLGGRWAVSGDIPWQQQANRKDKPNYGDKIASRYAQLLATEDTEGPMATPQAATDRLIAALRARGRNVIDMRGKLPINPEPGNRYGMVRNGLAGVLHWIQHWTGDAFTRATITKITGTDYGLDTIPANMTQQDEIELLEWYARFHISKDGGTWGGIAYGIMVFPSGRIYVNWNIGTLTYHAFSENAQSYAICCPASNGQAPTPECLVSLNHVWYVLCMETPECPAGYDDLYGHTEARQFDARNQTTCPGAALLGHVQRARASGAPTVPIALDAAGGAAGGGPVAELLAFADAIPFNQRGSLEWEGIVDLSEPAFGGGNAEPLAKYERLVAHRYRGQNFVMTLALWDRLRREGKIRKWPLGDVVTL